MRKPCGRAIRGVSGGCAYERAPGLQRCYWHWLKAQDVSVQQTHAERRLERAEQPHRARVSPKEWPDGERWCSGCQAFVPLFYASGSRCKACASRIAHEQRTEATYGVSADEYKALLELQGGRCYICRRLPRTKRLAVDHDHVTGDPRGLLCADSERGCNHSVLGPLEGCEDGPLAAAKRLVEYLSDPPAQRLRASQAPPDPAEPKLAGTSHAESGA